MNSILKIDNVIKKYPEVVAVDGISLEIPKGICFGLLGPNGAGKTTLIEVIEGSIIDILEWYLPLGNPRKGWNEGLFWSSASKSNLECPINSNPIFWHVESKAIDNSSNVKAECWIQYPVNNE